MTTWKTISYYEASVAGNEKVVFMQSTCMFNHRVGYCYNSWILDNNLSGKIHRPDSSSKGSYLSSENGGVGNGGAVLGRLRRTWLVPMTLDSYIWSWIDMVIDS